mmetsp:Transcript_2858/g.6542  ORF Transcript_2858/g.6542 Transcript_2858/m.6542 type:complete len:216 (+) Transcript_2858:187-834(+)
MAGGQGDTVVGLLVSAQCARGDTRSAADGGAPVASRRDSAEGPATACSWSRACRRTRGAHLNLGAAARKVASAVAVQRHGPPCARWWRSHGTGGSRNDSLEIAVVRVGLLCRLIRLRWKLPSADVVVAVREDSCEVVQLLHFAVAGWVCCDQPVFEEVALAEESCECRVESGRRACREHAQLSGSLQLLDGGLVQGEDTGLDISIERQRGGEGCG